MENTEFLADVIGRAEVLRVPDLGIGSAHPDLLVDIDGLGSRGRRGG